MSVREDWLHWQGLCSRQSMPRSKSDCWRHRSGHMTSGLSGMRSDYCTPGAHRFCNQQTAAGRANDKRIFTLMYVTCGYWSYQPSGSTVTEWTGISLRPQCLLNPLKPTVAVPYGWASECPDVKNYKWRLNPVWHRMHYSCTRMATVGFKGLMHFLNSLLTIRSGDAQCHDFAKVVWQDMKCPF